jgi:hypothetical protein
MRWKRRKTFRPENLKTTSRFDRRARLVSMLCLKVRDFDIAA